VWDINEAAPAALTIPPNFVLASHAFSGVKDVSATLAHIRAALAPGGFLYIQVGSTSICLFPNYLLITLHSGKSLFLMCTRCDNWEESIRQKPKYFWGPPAIALLGVQS